MDLLFYGDATVILRPRATCHSVTIQTQLPVAGHLDFVLMRTWRERGHSANVEKSCISRKKERGMFRYFIKTSKYPFNLYVQWCIAENVRDKFKLWVPNVGAFSLQHVSNL